MKYGHHYCECSGLFHILVFPELYLPSVTKPSQKIIMSVIIKDRGHYRNASLQKHIWKPCQQQVSEPTDVGPRVA